MSIKTEALSQIDFIRKTFDRTTSVLEEKDAAFRATPENATIAYHIAHVAQTIDWFREGGFGDHWRMDFEVMGAEAARVQTLAEGRRWLADAWDRLRATVADLPEAKLEETMGDNPILPNRRRYHTLEGLVDHCAHHRGALAVYARLLGKVPPMPYGGD
jgi:uncharacterized damage-inducible protein DinB